MTPRERRMRSLVTQLVICLTRRDNAALERDRPYTDPERRAVLAARWVRLCDEQDDLEAQLAMLQRSEP